MAVPYTFATATSSIPLSQLDTNFATAITLGNTAVYLGNTTTSIGNLTLTNTTISSVASTFPNSFLANSSVTLGTTSVSLGGTASTLANLTLSNVTISSGTSTATQNLANVTGTLAVGNGGTGLTSLTSGYIPYGNGTSPFSSSSNFQINSSASVLGLGVSPRSWGSGRYSLDIPLGSFATDGLSTQILNNAYYNGSNWIYESNNYATLYSLGAGIHSWYYAASGTAGGAVSFSEAMRISSAGKVGINATAPGAQLQVVDSTASGTFSNCVFLTKSDSSTSGYYLGARIALANTSATSGNFCSIGFNNAGGNDYAAIWGICTGHTAGSATGSLVFGTSNSAGAASEAMRITSAGRVGIGNTSPGYPLDVTGDASFGSGTSGNIYINGSGGTGACLFQILGGGSGNPSWDWGTYSAPDTMTLGYTVSGSRTERMRIDTSGNLLVGTTSNGGWQTSAPRGVFQSGNVALSAYCTDTGTNDALAVRRDVTLGTLVRFYNSTNSVGTITYNGTNTLYNATSDQRLKENIVDSGSAIEKISSIKVRAFDWIKSEVHTDFGVIAQELQKVAPECVTEGEDNEDGTMKNPWSVDTSVLVPALIKAVQELSAEVNQLKQKLGV